MNACGIDPGLTGALAIVNEQGLLFVDDLPVLSIPSGRKLRTELDLATLRELLLERAVDHVFIEHVAARPGQGVTSMFRFGFCAGAIIGLIAGLRMPYSLIMPSPDMARQRAQQLYPNAASYLRRKKDGGRADAILIARAGLLHPTHHTTPHAPSGNQNRGASNHAH